MAANGDITATVSVSGKLLDGTQIADYSESKVFSGIVDVFQRTLTVPTSLVTLLTIGTVAGATLAALNYLAIKNEDAANFLTVGFIDTSAKSVYFKIPAGKTLVVMDGKIECDDDAGGAFAAFNDTDTVTIQADTGSVRANVIAF